MIDAHVHLRDQGWKHKETIEHGLHVAEQVGLAAVFDMPNNSPPTINRENVEERLSLARQAANPVFYGLYIGVTPNPDQVKRAIELTKEFSLREAMKRGEKVGVVGLKMFAGHSVGDLTVNKVEDQQRVYQILARESYEGVLTVHCEKESELHPEEWNPKFPATHSLARPIEAETESVYNQIVLASAAGFARKPGKGHLHILHASTRLSIDMIDAARQPMNISCEVTPHHLLLSALDMNEELGLLGKVNPPLRSLADRKMLLIRLRQGKIDYIATDHAPHTYAEKTSPPYMSGFPGLPFWPHLITFLQDRGLTEEQIQDLTHNNINRIFNLNINSRNPNRNPNLHTEYEVDVYRGIREKPTRK